MTHRSKQKAVNTGEFGEGMFNVPKQLRFCRFCCFCSARTDSTFRAGTWWLESVLGFIRKNSEPVSEAC